MYTGAGMYGGNNSTETERARARDRLHTRQKRPTLGAKETYNMRTFESARQTHTD